MSNHLSTLRTQFPTLHFEEQFPLAPLTTVKIGGPAEIFCEVQETKTLLDLVSFCRKNSIPVTMIGWGANTLIADNGISGLVIRFKTQSIEVLDTIPDLPDSSASQNATQDIRWNFVQKSEGHEENFSDINYDESTAPPVAVKIAAGTPLPFAINTLLAQGITGLQWFSRIPSTIGGAIANNIHGGTHFFGEYILSVTIIDEAGEVKELSVSQLELGYDYSRFHHTDEIIVETTLQLFRGDVEKAKQVATRWAVLKKEQPQNSLGCVFQNITPEEQRQLNLPTTSTGYLIDKVLGLKGHQIGGAQISDKHAAFIINTGNATASDFLQLVKLITERAAQQNIKLKPEIFFKGFSKQELS